MQIIGILFVLASGAALIALLYALSLLMPGPVEKARFMLDHSLGKCFLLGLVNILFAGAIVFLLLRGAQMIRDQGSGGAAVLSGLLVILAFLIVLAAALLALNGLVSIASLFGMRMSKSKGLIQKVLWGSLLLVLASLTPYVGWFIFAPAMICLGVGATILTLAQPRRIPAADETAA
jgi:hypothetical protein